MEISKTKLLDALHGAMPSDHDAAQTNVANTLKKGLQSIVDLVATGELDAELNDAEQLRKRKEEEAAAKKAKDEAGGKTGDDKGEQK